MSMRFTDDAISLFKTEIGRMNYYLHRMRLPVNNFLKDHTQIETELIAEKTKDPGQFMLLDGQLVPVDQVLSRPMEENY
jgi:hypothetical protein